MLFLIAFLSLSSSLTCPQYKSSNQASTQGECQQCNPYESPPYIVTPCMLELMCPETANATSSCQNYSNLTRLPGEYCQQDADCVPMCSYCKGGPCNSNHQCDGLKANTGPCTSTQICDPGLFCNGGYCRAQTVTGGACTSTVRK